MAKNTLHILTFSVRTDQPITTKLVRDQFYDAMKNKTINLPDACLPATIARISAIK